MENFLSCPICMENFDNSLSIPLMLCCGHSLCKSCVIEIWKTNSACPLDRKIEPRAVEDLPKNIALLQIATHKTQKKSYPCITHPNRKIKYFCLTCRKAFCINCMVGHSGHVWVDLESSENIREKLKGPVDRILQDLEKANEYAQIYQMHMQNCCGNSVNEIKKKFSKIRNFLDKKEGEILNAVRNAERDMKGDLEERYLNAVNVARQREAAFREVEKVAIGIEDPDLMKKVQILAMVDGIIQAGNGCSLLPFEEMIQDFKVAITECTAVKKEINKLQIEQISHMSMDAAVKRKKIHEEVFIIN